MAFKNDGGFLQAFAELQEKQQQHPQTAEGWKDAGNAAFKQGRHGEAIECYGHSLALAPSCLAYANRAMALLKLGRHAQVMEDCSQAIGLDPEYTKAYQRRWGGWVGLFD